VAVSSRDSEFDYSQLRSSALKVRSSGSLPKTRTIISFDAFGSSELVGSFTSNLHNARAAILARVLFAKRKGVYVPIHEIVPCLSDLRLIMRPFVESIKPELPLAAPMTTDQFLLDLTGRKRVNYAQACVDFNERGFRPSDAHIRMFLKFEKDITTLKKDRIPRVISPAGFVYLLLTGLYIKAVEKKIYHAIDTLLGYRCVAKGINYDDLAEMISDAWGAFKNPAGIDLDVSKLDQSICADALRVSHDLIISCFGPGDRAEISRLLEYQCRTIAKARMTDGWLSYKVEGTLTSGQMNTSLTGICIVVGVIYPLLRGGNMRLINCGDDCHLVGEHKYMKGVGRKLEARFGMMGMVIEITKPFVELTTMRFCQVAVLRSDTGYRCVRDPYVVITKDSCCLENINVPYRLAAWARSVGRGGVAMFGGVPVLDAFYRCLIRNSEKFFQTTKLSKRAAKRARSYKLPDGYTNWGEPISYQNSVVDDTIRYEVFVAFNIAPADQLMLEDHYNNLDIDFTVERRTPCPGNFNLLFQ